MPRTVLKKDASWHKNACSRLLSGIFLLAVCSMAASREIDHVLNEVEDLRDRVRDQVQHQIEERMRAQVRARVRVSIEDSITESISSQVDDNLGLSEAPLPRPQAPMTEQRQQPTPSARLQSPEIAENIDGLIESRLLHIEDAIDLAIDTMLDAQGRSALSHQWLVLSDKAGIHALAEQGFSIISIEDLDGLGYLLGTISAPATHNPELLELATVEIMADQQVVVDLNHVYMPQRDTKSSGRSEEKLPGRRSESHSTAKIGMIDSSIDQSHPVFQDASIDESLFTPRGFQRSEQHGTAIASILVGNSSEFQGQSPGSKLFNGVIFATDVQGNEFSTTAAIVRALNWLAEQEVTLINMSLAGPDNAILRRAVEAACGQGITLVSSVGNAGPNSTPLYPSAYPCTIAVTGVDDEGLPYHRANRGAHIDFSLPGVNVTHATAGGGFGKSSGTSFAAATLSGMIAASPALNRATPEQVRQTLKGMTTDLGNKGFDTIFGSGLLLPTAYISD